MSDAAETIPEHPALYVLSDLHLAPPGEHCVFAAHEKLVSLLDHITASPQPRCVVLNGDVFDFLQIENYDRLSLPQAATRMTLILDALDREPRARNVTAALRRLTVAGHTLHCLAGNHDPELHLHTVQKVLGERLGATQLPQTADGVWRMRVAGRDVVGAHGHDHKPDPFNAISRARMLEAQSDGDAEVPLPPGSRLVCGAINPYRRARDENGRLRFPFVDLLPSDQAVILALLLLDPRLAAERLRTLLGITPAVLLRWVRQSMGGAVLLRHDRALSAVADREANKPVLDGNDPDAVAVAAWLGELATPLGEAAAESEANEQLLMLELEDYLAAPPTTVRLAIERGDAGGHDLLDGDPGLVQGLLWRALGKALEGGRDAFRPHAPDALAVSAWTHWPQADVILTGHTHAAKAIARVDATTQVYLNTGTWLDLTPIPQDTSQPALARWLADIAGNQVLRWQGCPVARVDAAGAQLLHWDGAALDDWGRHLPQP